MTGNFASLLQRFQGHPVSLSTFDRGRVLGVLAHVGDDCIRLTGVLIQDDLESGGWDDRYLIDDLKAGRGNLWPEIIVQRHHINSVMLLDESDVADFSEEVRPELSAVVDPQETASPVSSENRAHQLDDVLHASLYHDAVIIELGARLLPLVREDETKGKSLTLRVTCLRRELEQRFGFALHAIPVRFNLLLQPEQFRIQIHGTLIQQGILQADKLLAFLPEGRHIEIPGIRAVEPAFGLPAMWIEPQHRKAAESAGCTVVDPCSVMVTSLGACVEKHIAELLTYDCVAAAVERLRETHPKTISTLVPQPVSLRSLFEVLRSLVKEGVFIGHILPIIESVARHVEHVDSMESLVSRVRMDVHRMLGQRYLNSSGVMPYISIDVKATTLIFRPESKQEALDLVPPDLASCLTHLISEVRRITNSSAESSSVGPVLVVDGKHRIAMWKLLRRHFDAVAVLSFEEMTDYLETKSIGTITAEKLSSDFEANSFANSTPVACESLPQKPR